MRIANAGNRFDNSQIKGIVAINPIKATATLADSNNSLASFLNSIIMS